MLQEMIGEHPSGKDNEAITAMRLLAQASTNASNVIADFCFKLEEDMRELEYHLEAEVYQRLRDRAADKIWTEDDGVTMLRHLTADTECIPGFGHERQTHIQNDPDFDYTEASIDLSNLRNTHPKWDASFCRWCGTLVMVEFNDENAMRARYDMVVLMQRWLVAARP